MKTAKLVRGNHTDEGTFGSLAIYDEKANKIFACLTAELPWRNNLPDKSCVPPGKYTVVLSPSPRLKHAAYRLEKVPGREGILFHAGNWAGDKDMGYYSDLEGCIAVGQQIKICPTPSGTQQKTLCNSRAALYDMMSALGGEPFELTIV